MKEEYRDEILRMVVEEAIQKDKDRGLIIDNPTGYFNYKMERARHQAKEDPSWLMRQKDRLMGATTVPLGMKVCARCGHHMMPNVVYEYDGNDYCDQSCAEGTGQRISLKEWMRGLRRLGEKHGTREDDQGNVVHFTVTYEQAARTNPKIAREIEEEESVF